MDDSISILYYTCNRISDFFSNNVRNHLLESSGGKIPIISISHKPMDFGENICVSGMEISVYSVYKQILMGAKRAKTKYVACAEDDALYVSEHFECKPPDDTFLYNVNRWGVTRDFYFYRQRRLMSMCVAPTQLMIDTLETRFAKYSECVPHFGEPGRYERQMGLPIVKIGVFKTEIPTLTFSHEPSLGGRRKLLPGDLTERELPCWGQATELWSRFYGHK
jgi:hypothetical protein